MTFETRKIRKKLPKQKPPKPKKIKPVKSEPLAEKSLFTEKKIKNGATHHIKKHSINIGLPLIASLLVIFLLVFGIIKVFKSIDFTVLMEASGDELLTDSYGHTNFLLLGTGGVNHEGSDLTDTIIVASLDRETKLVTMLSIPRDLWVKDDLLGSSRINEVYYLANKHFGNSTEGLNYTKKQIEEMVGIPIHYWVKVNFQGFTELVDALGGVDVVVENDIYDPYYPKDETYDYETFQLKAGPQHLDGETALKYARSRKTTSDFDRARRQQDLIFAIKEQALKTRTILSIEKLSSVLNVLQSNIETNITPKEILTLGAIAGNFNKESITQRLIHDDPTKCGGLLYTPSREFYNGMFVLIPAGGFEFIHRYADLNFNMPTVVRENEKIQILNGTHQEGTAAETKQILKRYCFDIVRFGNARSQDIATTTYYYKPKTDAEGNIIATPPDTLSFLTKIIPGTITTEIPPEYLEAGYMNETDILIEIGSDYTSSASYIEDPFYYLWSLPTTTEATTE